MHPARRPIRRTLSLSASLLLAVLMFACSDSAPTPSEPVTPEFATTASLDAARNRVIVARRALNVYAETGEISDPTTADRLRRRLNEALEGIARNRIPDAIQALNRFIALVNSETPRSITPAAAAALIAHARDIIALLGGDTGNQPPTPTITQPDDGASFLASDPITFAGVCTDPEDGDLTDASCTWSSSLSGPIGTGTSFTRVDLPPGTHTITLIATDSDGATGSDQVTIHIATANLPPAAAILAPDDGASFLVGDPIAFSGTGTDPEDGDLAGDDPVWRSSIDGQIGTGASFTSSDLSEGDHTITLTATDSDNASATDQIDISIDPDNQAPAATINAPADGAAFTVGDPITFSGTGTDPEDGPLTGGSLVWTSSIDGQIGTGESFVRNDLSAGSHQIALTATDSRGATATDQIRIIIDGDVSPDDIACGMLIEALISPSGDIDRYFLSGNAGDVILLTTTQTGGNFNASVRARTTIYNPDGTPLLTYDANSSRRIVLAQSGRHEVRVQASNGTTTGTYNIGLECLRPLGPTDGEIAPGAIVTQSVDKPADVDVLTVDGTAGQVALLTTTQTGGNFNASVRARTTIYNPDGTPLLTYDANSSRLITLPQTGKYIVTVYASNLFNDGTYNIGRQ